VETEVSRKAGGITRDSGGEAFPWRETKKVRQESEGIREWCVCVGGVVVPWRASAWLQHARMFLIYQKRAKKENGKKKWNANI